MPLSPAHPREHCHTREISCRGYRREDGLWDIEGHLVDTKPYEFTSEYRGTTPGGSAVHDMWIRLTIDDDMVIQACEASMESQPYDVCSAITPNFAKLAGIKIGKGWMRDANQAVGGIHGCTHLRELLPPIATTAFQTIYGMQIKAAREAGLSRPVPNSGKPRHINACHAYREDGEIVRETFPEFYTGGQAAD